ncbi:MAG: 16S rRNA (cytidine(1402)-2'-O)-methyltransferase [Candidatus Kapabacteria bacterium]|nr:16S rRNA (cytidine(1402)-2'-O)-methyltransferase [Candidatus Kapabacteria bacterium]
MKLASQPLVAALYLVPLPIGNREDITLRALRVLRDADIIACEDTRTTGQLLAGYGITPQKMMSLHDHNEEERAAGIIEMIQEGKSIALCSDAGTPGISDPGFRVVRAACNAGVTIIPLPGANAALTALIASGVETDAFYFAGFPPHKKGRMTFVKRVVERDCTTILYESPHRITKLIDELAEIAGTKRNAVIARELTKSYEEFLRGTLGELQSVLKTRPPLKGEIVVILQGIQAYHQSEQTEGDFE